MDDNTLLEAIGQMMDAKLKPINERLDSMEDKLDGLIEDHNLTREGVNTLLDWADTVSVAVKVPLKPAR